MAKTKKINSKLGDRIKNKYLKPGGGISLIERFPEYKDKKKPKKRR